MKKLLAFCLSLLTLPLITNAQQPLRCNTMDMDAKLRARYSLESLDDFENWMAAKVAAYKASPAYLSGQRAVITVPIVFHVIHNGDAVGSGENISQAQVNSQIDVLNEDYRKMMGTAGYNTNAVGADCEIEFCLAKIDPNGNILAEPGIDRRNLSAASWADNDIDATVKPQTIWDPTRYFNVWTVNFGGSSASLLGYAQFPSSSGLQGLNANGGAANTDGVVISYKACGRVGNVASPYNKGRTLTHEIGHAFGLRHIWGDQSCGNDYCDDTPTSSAANYGCPTGRNTCGGAVDMIENYMDYTDDACMNIFTNDQKTRMMAVFQSSPRRNTLPTSNVCTIPFTFSYTGKVVDATTNQGIANAKVFLDGPADYNVTTDANGNFTIANLQQDNYTIYAGKWGYVTNALGSQPYTTTTAAVTIALQKGYYDDFLFDYVWTRTGTATSGLWTRVAPLGSTYATGGTTYQANPGADVTGDYGNLCQVTGNSGTQAGTDDVDGGATILTSPVMDLSTYADPVVRYYRWFYNGGGSGTAPNDSMVISLVNGTTVIDIDKVGGATATNQWAYRSYRIKDYIPSPGNNIYLRVRVVDYEAGHLVDGALDLFRIIDSTSNVADAPVANFSSNVTKICVGSQVAFNDLSSNNPTSWAWTFEGGTPATSTSANPTVTYAAAGTYAVSLTATNTGGNSTTTQTGYIAVTPVVAAFEQNVQAICPGQSVTFTNGSSCNPTAIQWVFQGGSPATSTAQEPVVTYATPGYYDVTLIAGNSSGADTLVQNLSVQVFTPATLIGTTVADTNNTGIGSATVTVAGGVAPYNYVWSNGQTTITATGLAAGTYTVTVTGANGCSATASVEVSNETVIVNGIGSIFNQQVDVFPNPVRGTEVTLETTSDWLGANVYVIDALGRMVNTCRITTAKQQISLNEAAGVYTIKLSSKLSNATVRVVKE